MQAFLGVVNVSLTRFAVFTPINGVIGGFFVVASIVIAP